MSGPSLARILLHGCSTCVRAALGATGLASLPDFLLEEKYFQLSDDYRGRILDLGSGRGGYAAFLRSRGHEVVAVDVGDADAHASTGPVIYDGHTIPWGDDSFDVGLCMFVLHHLDQQEELLGELRRVVRRTVIIAEDLCQSRWDRLWTGLHSRLTYWGRSSGRGFHSDAEWRERFRAQGLTLRRRMTIPRWRLPYYPVPRAVYVLEIVNGDGPWQHR